MANANTIAAVYSTPALFLNTTTATAITKAGAPVVVGLGPNANVDGGRAFTVRMRGTATGGTGATLLMKLYLGTSATLANDSLLATFLVSGAAIPAAGGQFNLSATLSWDSVSQTVSGVVGGNTNGTPTTAAAVSAQTGIASSASLQFVAVATFGAALATNSITLTEFSIEQE